LLKAQYSNGILYVLTVPDNFADFYNLPNEVLNKIREVFCDQINVSIKGPSNISLYLYDNNTFIVESFFDTINDLKIVTKAPYAKITDLNSNKSFSGKIHKNFSESWSIDKSEQRFIYTIELHPHSFRIFKYE